MKAWTRWTGALIFVLVFVLWAERAPSPGDQHVASMRSALRSADLAAVANAAHAAGEDGVHAVVPALVAALTARSDLAYQQHVLPYLVDALVRLGARVPIEILDRIRGRVVGSGGFVLAVRCGEAGCAYLRSTLAHSLSERSGPSPTLHPKAIAAGHLLARYRDPHTAALLLPHLVVQVSVTVSDDLDTIGIGGGAGGHGVG